MKSNSCVIIYKGQHYPNTYIVFLSPHPDPHNYVQYMMVNDQYSDSKNMWNPFSIDEETGKQSFMFTANLQAAFLVGALNSFYILEDQQVPHQSHKLRR